MFSYDEIQKYNETDIRIYKYVISNLDKIQYMTIRELAKEIHVSTSTILRFCEKNHFNGYLEFKDALKKEADLQNARPPMGDLQELSDFFARANSSAFEEKLLFAIDVLKKLSLLFLSVWVHRERWQKEYNETACYLICDRLFSMIRQGGGLYD